MKTARIPHSLAHRWSQWLMAFIALCTAQTGLASGRTFVPENHEWVVHAGAIHAFDNGEEEAFASVELRLRNHWNGIRPWTGVFLVNASDSWFAGVGLLYEASFGESFRVSIGSGPFYYHQGHGPDLGHDLEFYSFIEPSYVFAGGTRVGLRLGHFSNARLSEHNPGTETVAILVSIPWTR